jgi:hypothetical protein
MNKKELVEAAIAKMNERREEARRNELERQNAMRDRNVEELKRIVGVHTYLVDYAPEATSSGIWITLPECFPIQVSGWGGRVDELTFGVSTSTGRSTEKLQWVHDIQEAIEIAHDAFNGN